MGYLDEYNKLKNKRGESKKISFKRNDTYLDEYERLKSERGKSLPVAGSDKKTDASNYAATVIERNNRLDNRFFKDVNKEKDVNDYNIFDTGNLYEEIEALSSDYEERKTEKSDLENKIANMMLEVKPESEIEREMKRLDGYSDLDKKKKELDAKRNKYEYVKKQQTINHLSKAVNNSDFEKYYKLGLPEYSRKLDNSGYKYMTDEEKKIYSYYRGKGDKESADKYYKALEETLNYRKAQNKFEDMEGNTALEILYGGKLGLQQFSSGIKNIGNMITGNDKDVSNVATSEQMLAGMINEDLKDDTLPMWYNLKKGQWEDKILGRSAAQIGFDALNTGANMIPSILTSLGVSAAATPAAGATVGSTLMGSSAAGNAYQNALAEGMNEEQAKTYGITIGALEGSLQYVLGGIGSLGGTSSKLAHAVSGIDNAALRFSLKYGGEMSSEALEEGLQEVLEPLVNNAVTGTTDKDINWEEVAYSALMGAFMSVAMGSKSKTDNDKSINEFTQNEQKVIDAEVKNIISEREKRGEKITGKEKNKIIERVQNNLEKGYISTDTIESVLGSETYNTYKSMEEQEKSISEEIEALENTPDNQFTVKQRERLTELREQLNNLDKTSVKEQLSNEVSELAKSDRLGESYNEKARRRQAFEADLTKYDSKQQEVVKKAVESGILNNTNRTHDFVDMIAKISADKGVFFDFTNNKGLKESGFALEGKIVNGYVDKNGNVSLNIDSAKSLNSVVGHEITHVLEGNEDLYNALAESVEKFGEANGEYAKRLEELTKLYEGTNADVRKEVVADMVGDYLFTDENFIKNLSTDHRNVFQKIYDEIKYLYKVATAGSKEQRKLEEVKKTFEKAYKESSNNGNSNIKYSLSKDAKIELHKALYEKGYNNEVILRDETPSIMISQKGVKNLPMIMKVSHIRENVFTEEEAKKLGLKVNKDINYHGLGEDFFLKVIDGLDDVDLAYRGTKTAENPSRRENYFLLISKLKDVEGNTVNVPVYINEHSGYNKVFIDVNKISTVFGRNNFETYISNQIKKNNLVRIKNRSNQTSESPTPIIGHYGEITSNSSISQNSKTATKNMSLSKTNDIAPIGNYNVYGKDMALPHDPNYTSENKKNSEYFDDIGPVREDIQGTNIVSDDIAPLPATEENLVIEDIAPISEEKAKEIEQKEIARILEEEPKTESQRNKRKWAIFKANVLDKGAVFEDLSLKSKNRELMGKWNYTLYSEAIAQRLINNGSYSVKSLNAIREKVDNTGYTREFYEYMYHKHNVDRMTLEERYKDVKNKPVFGDSVTADVSQEVVEKYEKLNPEFKGFAKDVYDYMTYLRNQMVDNGVISQETADLWQEMYPHYIPTRRVNDKGLSINVPLDTGRTGINAPVKKATGGSADILPLFDTMASRTLQTYKATAKNSFGVELKDTLGSVLENAETNIDEIIDNIDSQESLLQEGKNGSLPTFTVFENGEKVTFEITKDMYDALKPVSESSMLSKTNPILNIASKIHRGLLTEYNPVFMLTNAIKDTQDILINSQHSAKTYSKLPEAFAQSIKKGYWYNEYMANGGEQNTYFDNETNTFKTENKSLKILLSVPPLSTISKINNQIEIIPRLAEYIASRESGRSIEVSMLDAARVTTNFRAGGDLTKFLNRNGFTFLNASVQGTMQQVRNVREAKVNGFKGWANLATKFAIAGLPAIILNNMIWDDDDEYAELSDYVKQNYYIVGRYDDGKFIRIPKGRTLAVIQEGIKQIGNAATGNDEADLNSFLDLMVTNLLPNNPLKNNILAPIGQVKSNETWYGEDLVPSRLADLPAKEQFDESTDSISKWLGDKLNISPVKINYLLDQYTGGVGDVVLPMLTPKAESGDNSVVGNITAPLKNKFTADSVLNNQNVSDFYETSDIITTNAKKSNATDEDILKNKYINSVKAEIGELYSEKRKVQNSNMSDKDKYEEVRKLQSQINELSKKALSEYEDVDIENGYAKVGDKQFKLSDEGEWTKISNNQLEKQEKVTNTLGINATEYWSNKEEYDYAYENPDKYSISKVIGGYDTYRSYTKDINNIHSDKDADGKAIAGSSKEKKLDYINSLDIDYGQKIILYRTYYDSKEDKQNYNADIVDYLNSREDISYQEMVTILEALDMKISDDGTVTW